MTRALEFEHVTKRYVRGDASYVSLRGQLANGFRRTGRRPQGTLALEDLSFAVQEGESVGLVGPNGAGKTTALKLLSRISRPTSGRIRVVGRLAALIEVSSGLHPELTGRENIWLYGRILGMSRADIRRRFDAIVEFAELEHALDRPVKLYSSGMELRLGFAIAAHLEPDVFVVDEALAVGDAAFQAKCVERMRELVREGRTLLFVSHDLQSVEAFCDRAIFLAGGRKLHEGPARDTVARYLAWSDDQRQQRQERLRESDTGALQFASVSVHDLAGAERYEFAPGEGLEVRLRFASERPLRHPAVNLEIGDPRTGLLVQCSMLHDGQAPAAVGREWECRCRIASLPLQPRRYDVWCDVFGEGGIVVLARWTQVSSFRVVDRDGTAAYDSHSSGPVRVDYGWQVADA